MNPLLEKAQNIVFDIGGVLLSFEPEVFVPRLLPASDKGRIQARDIVGHPLWVALDEGTATEEEVARGVADAADNPALFEGVLRVIRGFQDYMQPLPACALIAELRAMGKRIYVLSNYGASTFSRAEKRFGNLFAQMDGMIISGRERLLKPDPRIYRLLLSRYRLDAAQTLFIDDRMENVLGAQAVGMLGLHYIDGASLQ